MVDADFGSGPLLVAARELTPDGESAPTEPLICATAPVDRTPAVTTAAINFII
jgi:hypothetical protein